MNYLTNSPLLYATMFLASLCYVGTRSIQQLNVANKLYSLIPIFSMVMAFLDVFVISMIVKHNSGELWAVALSLGGGGAIGSMLAVYLHDKYFKEKERTLT